jgi:carboxyl-terminal processing protease
MNSQLAVLILCLFCVLSGVSQVTCASEQLSYPELFEEITGIVEEHFHDPVKIEREFPAIQETYRKKVAQISSLKAFSTLVNEMLGELNASHTYYLTSDDYEYYHLGALFTKIPQVGALFEGGEVTYPTVGIMTQSIEGRVYVVSVLEGGAAEEAGLFKGDEIVSVDGKPYEPIAPLRVSPGTAVSFEIRRHEREEPFSVVMTPALIDPKQEMLEAETASVLLIDRGAATIGYIHLYSYAGEEYHKELLDALVWGDLKKADALIIDLRYGLGGAWPYYLNLFNRDIPVMRTIHRNGEETVIDTQWRKPAVYLVNGFTRSGKELLAFGAKRYHLATVIGERTAGHVLGGRLFPLSNGDMLFLAVQGYRIDGVDLEGVGVTPDIEVPFDVRYCAGSDAQLERAVEYLTDKLRSEKAGID